MGDQTNDVLRPYFALLTCLLGALPPSARKAYGDELAAVYRDMLRDTFRERGLAGVRSRMPGLIADAGTAVGLEYLDSWRRSCIPPLRVATWSLFGAAVVWGMAIVATVSQARGVVAVLEFNLALTVTLMLGLPAMSLLASRVGPGPGRGQPTGERTVLHASIAATAATWSLVLCHVAA